MYMLNKISARHNTGGIIRKMRGEFVERLVDDIVTTIALYLPDHHISCKTGTHDLIKIRSKSGMVKHHQTDRHIYVNGRLACVVECKSYLDACYYTRTCCDFMLFKKYDKNVKCIVLSMENGMNENTQIFYDDMFHRVVDEVIHVCDGKRCSSKPIYKAEYFKPLNKNNLTNFILYLWVLFQDDRLSTR